MKVINQNLATLFSVVVILAPKTSAFQNFLNNFKPLSGGAAIAPVLSPVKQQQEKLQEELLEAIESRGTRLDNDAEIDELIEKLEGLPSISEPAIAPEVYGRWRLLYTTNPDTSSPIQRKAVSSSQFPIFQDIVIKSDTENVLQVNQVVQFNENAFLSVDALASTAAYPLEEFTERKSSTTLGFNILGISLVGEEAKPDPNRPNSRIDFVFDEGNFYFGDKFKIPYPVPFRLPLLRDVVKGWIDITYLSDKVRISRGNKGTTFVLLKEEEAVEQKEN